MPFEFKKGRGYLGRLYVFSDILSVVETYLEIFVDKNRPNFHSALR